MIKASINDPDEPMLLAGLSDRNLELMVSGKPIVVTLASFSVSLPGRLMIMHGATEQAIVAKLKADGVDMEDHERSEVDALMRREAERTNLGATGDYPEGRLNEDDEGGLRMGLTAIAGFVVLNFGKPVAWLTINPLQARQMAERMTHYAKKAEQLAGEGTNG